MTPLEGVELARARRAGARGIGAADPVAHGLDVEREARGQLRRGEVLGDAVADRTPGGVVDHDRASITTRSRAKRTDTGTVSGRLSTW